MQFPNKLAALIVLFSVSAYAQQAPVKFSYKPLIVPIPGKLPVACPTVEPLPTAGMVNVKNYGAKGDGVTNDTDAFAAAAAEITKRKGGILFIPRATYLVGKQIVTPGKATQMLPIIKIRNVGHVAIKGNCAVLRADPKLKFGSFDPYTGLKYEAQTPFTNSLYRNDAYNMIDLGYNQSVSINNLELDGNFLKINVGGEWGDKGIQNAATGINLNNNEQVDINNIYTHHHGHDGIRVGFKDLSVADGAKPMRINYVVSEYNGRQGLSLVGGNDVIISKSRFNHTGAVGTPTPPRAGVDIEASNGAVVTNVLFDNVEIANNAGPGLVADSGPSSHVTIRRSVIWGTKSWALWNDKPFFRIEDSQIHGSIVRPYGSATDPASATKFIRTIFDDEPSPVYGQPFGKYLVDFASGGLAKNVVFDGCVLRNKLMGGFFNGGTVGAPVQILNSTLIYANDTRENRLQRRAHQRRVLPFAG